MLSIFKKCLIYIPYRLLLVKYSEKMKIDKTKILHDDLVRKLHLPAISVTFYVISTLYSCVLKWTSIILFLHSLEGTRIPV